MIRLPFVRQYQTLNTTAEGRPRQIARDTTVWNDTLQQGTTSMEDTRHRLMVRVGGMTQ